MRVVISATSKFHSLDLARELQRREALEAIFSGYPKFKLRSEALNVRKIKTFPYFHASYMALSRYSLLGNDPWDVWGNFVLSTFDRYVAANLPNCEIFCGQSGSSLRTGQIAKSRGIRYICDRGPSHIRRQDQILRDEFELWGAVFSGIDERIMEREEAEYQIADLVTVPSKFAFQSFVEFGVPQEKMRLLPYGVDQTVFYPDGRPKTEQFNVLFVGAVSLQKGIPYLIRAFDKVEHPKKTLTLAGSIDRQLKALLKRHNISVDEVEILGHVQKSDLKKLMSESHVLVLPSVQDGFGLVLAEAMACGCPVIGTNNTGAPDLVTDGENGFVVPIRNVDELAHKLQFLADDPDKRAEMGEKALLRVSRDMGWSRYGDAFLEACQSIAQPSIAC